MRLREAFSPSTDVLPQVHALCEGTKEKGRETILLQLLLMLLFTAAGSSMVVGTGGLLRVCGTRIRQCDVWLASHH